jgi:hypothetical protein
MVKPGLFIVWLITCTITSYSADPFAVTSNTNQPVWGAQGGLVWTLPPDTHPRGLFRIFYPVLPNGRYDLVNFIAVEPVVHGTRGFSELEFSQLDGVPGKRLWTENPVTTILTNSSGGSSNASRTAETTVKVEKFENGAHVRVVVRQQIERPDEMELSVFTEPDSQPLDYCILTATMGNRARTRQLWLKNEVVRSHDLYPDYTRTDFAPQRSFSLSRLQRTAEGHVLVAITTDEANPGAVYPFPGSQAWHYGGSRVTQYWMARAGFYADDLRVVVNGRYTYWRSSQPIPGGIAFENFELNQRFTEGQKVSFGITKRTPPELGFDDSSTASHR